jgi:hypothetical protein
MLEVRLRTRIHPDEMAAKVGKILTPRDYSLLLTEDCRVLKPDGQPLGILLKQAIPGQILAQVYPLFAAIREVSQNRGLASGAVRVQVRGTNYARPVRSTVLGFFEPSGGGRFPYARMTTWTERHQAQFRRLLPYFQAVAQLFATHLPERYARQLAIVQRTHPSYIIPDTPFSTVTVNQTYATGVHKDAGDYEPGFSCLGVLRRGQYRGAQLVFAEYRVAVELEHGDVLLMDPHEWHGNVQLIPLSDDAERISIVQYYRTKLADCAAPDLELARVKARFPVPRVSRGAPPDAPAPV